MYLYICSSDPNLTQTPTITLNLTLTVPMICYSIIIVELKQYIDMLILIFMHNVISLHVHYTFINIKTFVANIIVI